MDKNRVFSEFQKLGKVLMAPVLILPIAGILVGVGSGFTNPRITDIFPFLKYLGLLFNILKDAGKISHKQAIEKANEEYEKFRIKQDKEYISSMDQMLNKYLKENR